MKLYKGIIKITSQERKGTTVELFLPINLDPIYLESNYKSVQRSSYPCKRGLFTVDNS